MTSVVTPCCCVDITELKRGKMLVIQTGLVMELLARYRVINYARVVLLIADRNNSARSSSTLFVKRLDNKAQNTLKVAQQINKTHQTYNSKQRI